MKESRSASGSPIRQLQSAFCAVRLHFAGVAFCVIGVMAAVYISEHYGGPAILFALLLGMAFHSLVRYPEYQPGVAFCASHVLRFGVALLGLRISLTEMSSLGSLPFVVVLVGTIGTLAGSLLFGRLMGLNPVRALLSGVAVAICGVSAALAIAALLPRERLGERYLLCTLAGVAGISTLAMVLYPAIANSLSMDATLAGLFLGSTIHDVAQVAGAGYMLSETTGDVATFTKMLRVGLLVPVAFVVAMVFRSEESRLPLPWFLIVFTILAVANAMGWIPLAVQETGREATSVLLMVAMVALGCRSDPVELMRIGWGPMVMLLLNSLLIVVLVLAVLLIWPY